MRIKKGTLLVFEHGQYSDFSYAGPLRVVRDFDQEEVVEEYRGQWKPENEWESDPSERDFVAWMTTAGYVEAISDVHTWYVGSYGSLDPEIQDGPNSTPAAAPR